MKRLTASAAALALVLAACGASDAAIVNGTSVTTSEVADLLADSAAPEETLFTDTLYQVIVNQVISAAAEEDFGLTVSAEQLAAGTEELTTAIQASGQTLDDAVAAAGFSNNVIDMIVTQDEIQKQLAELFVADVALPSEDEILASFNASFQQLANVCVSHILLETEEDAEDVVSRLDGGEDFAELAQETSTGPSGPDGGDLGCSAPAQYVAEFAIAALEAPVGEPFGPVQTQFGFHVLLVSDRTTPELEDNRQAIVEQLQAEQQGTLLNDWYVAQLREADVQVAEEYGTWTLPEDATQAPSIVPPSS